MAGTEGSAGMEIGRGLVLIGCAGIVYRGHNFTPQELAKFQDDNLVYNDRSPTNQIMWLAARLPLVMVSMGEQQPRIEMEYQTFGDRTAAYRFTPNEGTVLAMPSPNRPIANPLAHVSPDGLVAISFDYLPYSRIIAAVKKPTDEQLLPPLEPPAGLRLPSWRRTPYD